MLYAPDITVWNNIVSVFLRSVRGFLYIHYYLEVKYMKKLNQFWASLDGETAVPKKELFFEITTCILAGIVIGMIFSPKKCVAIGSNNSGNGCNCGNQGADDEPLEF